MICSNCGSEINAGVKFCTNCGSSIDSGDNSVIQQPSPTVSPIPTQSQPIEPVVPLEQTEPQYVQQPQTGVFPQQTNAQYVQQSPVQPQSGTYQQQTTPQYVQQPQYTQHPQTAAFQQQMNPADPSWPVRNKIVAGVLAILLGGIGVHKFYLGKIGMGILYLLFCWTFIPALAGLIEGIIYLTSSDEKFQQKHKVRLE